MKDFNDKMVFLVGGSSGIGLSTAKLLAARGAGLVLFARNSERLEKAVAQAAACGISPGQTFSFMTMDASDPGEVKKVMTRAVAEFSAPDVLINSAGRAIPGYFADLTYERFEATMKTNLYGTWNTVSALVPHMKEKGGAIVNVSSVAGFVGVFGYTDYCASKFGVLGFSEALRSELKPLGISVFVLCPPDTDTPGLQEENKTKPVETQALSGNVKLMGPDDVAKALLKGMAKGQFLIIPGFDGRITHLAKRFLPGLVTGIMDRTIKKLHGKS